MTYRETINIIFINYNYNNVVMSIEYTAASKQATYMWTTNTAYQMHFASLCDIALGSILKEEINDIFRNN